MWNLLSSAKHGRVMLLTTHSMEEADVLGDRCVAVSFIQKEEVQEQMPMQWCSCIHAPHDVLGIHECMSTLANGVLFLSAT